jgi:nucleoside-diphosphate-sugar epimerase
VTARVLVTGASGFVGRPALAALAKGGADVHAVARTRPAESPDGVEWHECDLLEPGAGRALVNRVRAHHLLHLAWTTEPTKYWTSPENDRWQAASRDLIEGFAAAGGRRAVVAGTCAEYQWGSIDRLREDSPVGPRSRYAAAKDALRREVEQVGGVSAVWARLFFLYGPGEDYQRLVPTVIDALERGERPRLSPGTHRRDYLYVDDAATALTRLLAAELTGPVNVASGRAPAIRDLVLAIAQAAGRPELIEFGALPAPEEAGVVQADIERLRGAIRFAPRDLETGTAETVRWRYQGRWRRGPAGDS